jgi:phage gp36-like protein
LPYAVAADFVATVTEAEAIAVARAAAPATGYDEAIINGALANASTELDTYFAARYPTPLSPVPDVAKQATIALAREALDRQGRDHVKTAAARWRAWAKDVAKGLAVLGGGVVGEDVPAASAASGAQFSAPDRIFTGDSLAPFLGRAS